MPLHKHLPHLTQNWSSIPIYFITVCTYHRKPFLIENLIAEILIDEWSSALENHGWMVGRYVIMPDHVHFFCTSVTDSADPKYTQLSKFMQQWKQWTSKRIIHEFSGGSNILIAPIWQKEFFDHLLRSNESYAQKWDYVRENPVRKKLVEKADNWKLQGEIYDLCL
jgi:putative transposase